MRFLSTSCSSHTSTSRAAISRAICGSISRVRPRFHPEWMLKLATSNELSVLTTQLLARFGNPPGNRWGLGSAAVPLLPLRLPLPWLVPSIGSPPVTTSWAGRAPGVTVVWPGAVVGSVRVGWRETKNAVAARLRTRIRPIASSHGRLGPSIPPPGIARRS